MLTVPLGLMTWAIEPPVVSFWNGVPAFAQ